MSQAEISITGEPVSDTMCRFIVDRPVYPEKSCYLDGKEAAKDSLLAERLFEIDGIQAILISHDQLTVTKNTPEPWPSIGKTIGAAIRAQLVTGEPAVSDAVR